MNRRLARYGHVLLLALLSGCAGAPTSVRSPSSTPADGAACGALFDEGDARLEAVTSALALDKPDFSATQPRFSMNGSTLALEVPYAPVARIFDAVNNSLGGILKNRGEAHITVLTPTEFKALAKKKIQAATGGAPLAIQVLGVGSGHAAIAESRDAQAYFIVVKCDELNKIRADLQARLVQAGGNAKDLPLDDYYPHVTIGFTVRDLHEKDGVIKDLNSLDPRFTLRPKGTASLSVRTGSSPRSARDPAAGARGARRR